ncbi:ABC transporter ATP-binding protein [Lachnospiraceae bacterium ZAX-1]
MNLIRVEHVSKTINKNQVLADVNLKLCEGLVYGFVGKNGSGKTMLLRVISGLVKPTQGAVWVNDKKLHTDMSIVPNLGIMLENTGLYPEFTGFQNLKFLAGIHKKIGDEEIRSAIGQVGLDPIDKRAVRKYSLGMQQRILLAQAIMEQPEYLFLDEPGNGLDDTGMELMRALVQAEKNKGTMVLLASHNKEDIDLLCDTVFHVKEGRVTEVQA